ncbi:MAG: ABC transporter ATP-binding protein, partial [Acidimicrobiia bacterium]
MSAILSVKGVTKRFGGLTALHEVSLDLTEGEILGI